MPTLSALAIYPLKSCAGLPLEHATVEPRGLAHDRRWMAVRPDGTFLTGREQPALLRLHAVPTPGGLRLSAPGLAPLEVPRPAEDTERQDVTVWGDTCSAARAGLEADRWLSDFLGEPLRLVHVDARMRRPVERPYADPGDEVGFADAYPLLLTTEASLAELNTRLDTPVGMAHFRPNLVVTGCEPFAEDRWKRVRIGGVEFALRKPCARCVLITVDPETARPHPHQEPLRTLATYRKRGNKVLFGQNVLPRGEGTLRVGDAVEVLEEG
ncbi:MOSC domain-containing protein [Archangium primigenium]|uniref:MOSC domain-containing protein n=1 Tax=[Archangium] primigenium TaxID=2792470 RepID=UPI00195783BC|nr:MOSC domain-containing protein [Archangium primigenium]MBM7115491.1 MOSC domain-containing protein [Archangium primigenium]